MFDHLAAPAQAGPVAWNVALGVASLVLLTGGIVAMVKRSMRPGQALGVLGVALGVLVITAFASRFPSEFSRILIIGPVTVAGMAMAAAIVTRPPPRIP